MSYLAKIKAKTRPSGTDNTDKTPAVDSSVSSVSPPQAHIDEKDITLSASSDGLHQQVGADSAGADEYQAGEINVGTRPSGTDKTDKTPGDLSMVEILRAFDRAAFDLPVTSQAVYKALDPRDIDAWRNGELSGDNLRAFALAVHESQERKAGRIPDSYEDIATCDQCGPVWWFISEPVSSCPWCMKRLNGWPIPRPGSVTCGACRHFKRRNHAHLGNCGAGVQPYGTAGFWDTDRHACKYWLSSNESV